MGLSGLVETHCEQTVCDIVKNIFKKHETESIGLR